MELRECLRYILTDPASACGATVLPELQCSYNGTTSLFSTDKERNLFNSFLNESLICGGSFVHHKIFYRAII